MYEPSEMDGTLFNLSIMYVQYRTDVDRKICIYAL